MKFVITVVAFAGVLLKFVALGNERTCKDGPPLAKDLRECCNMPNLIDKTIRTDCLAKYGEQTLKQMKLDGTPRGCCIAECQLNATGLYSEGVVMRDEMTMMFTDAVEDIPSGNRLCRIFLIECFRMAEANMEIIEAGAKLEPSFEGKKICHPISGAIMRCMNKNMFLMCPLESYTEGPECNQLMDYFKMCTGI